MLDKGAPLEKRVCPIKAGKTRHCIKCSPCHIMNGYGGAGTLSDGKYNITTQFGGELHKYVGTSKAMELMEYVDSVLKDFAASGIETEVSVIGRVTKAGEKWIRLV